MAMSVGTVAATSGMTKAIYDSLISEFSPPADVEEIYKRLAFAYARGVVDYIKANADVIVRTTDAGLQRDDADVLPTLAPAADVTMPGPGVID